jgi:hypothetical protein
MHELSWLGLGLGSYACFGVLPTVLTIFACIDIYRRREPWWWFPIVFFFPWFGTIAYFVLTRAPWRLATDITVSRDRRRRADARLRALDTQLGHWRGPAVLAEAGEELLVLGRHAEARERFVEARKAGAGVDDVNLGLAETLVALQAHAEAIPVLEELLLAQPDAGLGRARILLARCLEALGRNGDAEASWRLVLERRNDPEAQARLARLLLLRGESNEASRLAHEVIADAKLVGAGLRRRRRPWVDLSRQVVKGRAAKVPGQARRGAMRRWAWIVAVGALLILLGLVAIAMLVLLPIYRELVSAAQQAKIEDSTLTRVAALDVMYPWTRGTDPTLVALEPADVDAWLQARLGPTRPITAETTIEAGRHACLNLPSAKRVAKSSDESTPFTLRSGPSTIARWTSRLTRARAASTRSSSCVTVTRSLVMMSFASSFCHGKAGPVARWAGLQLRSAGMSGPDQERARSRICDAVTRPARAPHSSTIGTPCR